MPNGSKRAQDGMTTFILPLDARAAIDADALHLGLPRSEVLRLAVAAWLAASAQARREGETM
jgi:hypothetical protein